MPRVAIILARIVLPIVLVGLGIGGFAYFVATKPVETPKPVKERVWNVASMVAAPASRAPEIRMFGTLKSARNVDLRSLVAGEVVNVGPNFHEGALLAAGDLLIEIDDFVYRAAVTEKQSSIEEGSARLKELQANEKSEKILLARDREILDLEKRNVARSEKLRKKGNISDKSLDTARTTLNRQRQQVAQREAQLDILKAKIRQQQAVINRMRVALTLAERDLSNTRLVAPYPGYVADISVELGKRIDAKDKVARLIDSTRLEVGFHLPSREYGLLLNSAEGVINRHVAVSWKIGETTKVFTGKVARIGSEIQAETGGVELIAALDQSLALSQIRAGAFVQLTLIGEVYSNSIEVPDYAVYNRDRVYVVEEGRLVPRTVEVLYDNGISLIVRGDLKRGDQIVTTRFAEIGPGIKVEVR